jgi:DNA-binding LytR/AlgR family response regulator
MKPLSVSRLATTISRVKERLSQPPAHLDEILAKLANRDAGTRSWLRWINASQGQNVRLITVDEICYFKADSKYTLVVTPDSESLIRKPIRDLLGQLDPEMFQQIHRSTIVNIGAVAAVHRCENGTCEVRLKGRTETLTVSVPFVHLFRQM